MQIYWTGDVPAADDFGSPIGEKFVDGSTRWGWAIMSLRSFAKHGRGRLGTGVGQMYQRQPDGRWLKVAG